MLGFQTTSLGHQENRLPPSVPRLHLQTRSCSTCPRGWRSRHHSQNGSSWIHCQMLTCKCLWSLYSCAHWSDDTAQGSCQHRRLTMLSSQLYLLGSLSWKRASFCFDAYCYCLREDLILHWPKISLFLHSPCQPWTKTNCSNPVEVLLWLNSLNWIFPCVGWIRCLQVLAPRCSSKLVQAIASCCTTYVKVPLWKQGVVKILILDA